MFVYCMYISICIYVILIIIFGEYICVNLYLIKLNIKIYHNTAEKNYGEDFHIHETKKLIDILVSTQYFMYLYMYIYIYITNNQSRFLLIFAFLDNMGCGNVVYIWLKFSHE